MNKKPPWYFTLFIVVVLIQVLFMNNIQFSGFVNPYFYVLFILLMPISTPRYLLLLLGFVLGVTVDVFSNTPGIHASATVFMAFVRPAVVNASNIDDNDYILIPSIARFGFRWFVRYAGLLILLHHLFLFYIEMFTFNGFFQTLLRSLLSSIFTFVFIVISQFLMFRK
jgi:rod shape-determining protein MreD